MDELTDKIVTEAVQVMVNNGYNDGLKPAVTAVGKIVAIPFELVYAALKPIRKYVMIQEANLKETAFLLQEKLKNVPKENFVDPKINILAPAVQAISYCADVPELRDMFASLLANTMNSKSANKVLPCFVEILKQLTPDEARMLAYLSRNNLKTIPIVTLRAENDRGEGVDVVVDFTDIGERALCEYVEQTRVYIDNLIRLGLLRKAVDFRRIVDPQAYDKLKNHTDILEKEILIRNEKDYCIPKIVESYIELTSLGLSLCEMCIDKNDVYINRCLNMLFECNVSIHEENKLIEPIGEGEGKIKNYEL